MVAAVDEVVEAVDEVIDETLSLNRPIVFSDDLNHVYSLPVSLILIFVVMY